jgi:hypothetical protein
VKPKPYSQSPNSPRSRSKIYPANDLWNLRSHFFGQIATIEISTAIVDEIVEEIFIPWEAYRQLYEISREALVDAGIDRDLHDRYLQLRRQLELEYHLLLLDPDSPLSSRALGDELTRDLEILGQNSRDWENLTSKLPPPLTSDRATNLAVKRLLNDRYFLSVLRRLDRFKNSLDRQQQGIPNEKILARTSIQLDGTISHCYCQEIFHHPEKNSILKLHERIIASGEQQWRKTIEFVIELVRTH